MLELDSEVNCCLVDNCEFNSSYFFSVLGIVNYINIENFPKIGQIFLNKELCLNRHCEINLTV